MTERSDRAVAEERFRPIFAQLAAITAYARRRGSADAEGIAAETMAIAWRRLADIPRDDPLPWLYATARNLLFAERRRARRGVVADVGPFASPPEVRELDPRLDAALRALSPLDREALLLIAWEDLSSTQAARVLGINATAFRVRLLRARRRVRAHLAAAVGTPPANVVHIDAEGT